MTDTQTNPQSDEDHPRRRRPRGGSGLFVTDIELIERLDVPEKIAREALRALDKTPGSGFPPKQKLWGDRRYWPAVLAFFDRASGLTMDALQPQRERHDRRS